MHFIAFNEKFDSNGWSETVMFMMSQQILHLIGRRKQAVNSWCGKIFLVLCRFHEPQFVTTERGLTQLKRCQFNYELLNMLLDELMPWLYCNSY